MDPHAARFAQMCDAARGKPNVIDALTAAGFTAAEILDEHIDVTWELRREQALQREYQKDRQEYDNGDPYA
jgi:hypothetical protein